MQVLQNRERVQLELTQSRSEARMSVGTARRLYRFGSLLSPVGAAEAAGAVGRCAQAATAPSAAGGF